MSELQQRHQRNREQRALNLLHLHLIFTGILLAWACFAAWLVLG